MSLGLPPLWPGTRATAPAVATGRRGVTPLVVAVLGTLTGAVAAAEDGRWGLLTVLAVALGAQLMVLARSSRRRRPLVLRGDLAGWLHERSAATGEPVEHLADRCVAAYRAGLTGGPDELGGGSR